MEIYNVPGKWKLQEHCCGDLHLPRRVEFSTALLCKSTLSQKNGSFNSTATEISIPSSIFHFPISDTRTSKDEGILLSKL
jgi:hypothetical protein